MQLKIASWHEPANNIWYLSQNYSQMPLINAHIDVSSSFIDIRTQCVQASKVSSREGSGESGHCPLLVFGRIRAVMHVIILTLIKYVLTNMYVYMHATMMEHVKLP